MARKRMFLTGSERAEYEHVHGPLTVDSSDPRFVLVDDETEEAIRKFPPGVPPTASQDWEQVKRIKEAQKKADERASGESVATPDSTGHASVPGASKTSPSTSADGSKKA